MKYVFVGEGPGVPGLAHEISDEEAAAQGLTELLQAAIANGNYAPVASRPGAGDVGMTPSRPVAPEEDVESTQDPEAPRRRGKHDKEIQP